MAAVLAFVGVFSVEWVENLTHLQLLCQTVLPTSFGPPADDVFADAVESLVSFDHLQYPIGKEIDVCVAVGCQHAYSAVFSDHAVADWEAFLRFGDVP